MTDLGVKGNPQEAKGRNMSKEQLNAYLEDDESSSSTDTSLESSHGKDTFPVLRSRLTDAIALMGCIGVKGKSSSTRLTIDDVEFEIVGYGDGEKKMTLGVNNHKLLMYACKLFTKNNHVPKKGERQQNTEPNRRVTIPLRDYATALGYTVEPADDSAKEQARAKNELDNARKDMLACARTLISTHARMTGRSKDKYFEGRVNIFESTGCEIDMGKKTVSGEVILDFAPKMANILLTDGKITQFPYALLSVDPRDPNAYRIGSKMYTHANMDANILNGTHNRLRVETLLKETDLPTIDTVRKTNQSWGSRIRKPFIDLLDRMVCRHDLLTGWTFVGENGSKLDDADLEKRKAKYTTFAELYVLFDLAHKVDHTDRLSRRKEETRLPEATEPPKEPKKPAKRAKRK